MSDGTPPRHSLHRASQDGVYRLVHYEQHLTNRGSVSIPMNTTIAFRAYNIAERCEERCWQKYQLTIIRLHCQVRADTALPWDEDAPLCHAVHGELQVRQLRQCYSMTFRKECTRVPYLILELF